MKKWLLVIRAPFLLLAVVLGFLGASIAWYEANEFGSSFNIGYAWLALFGILLTHISVNVFNEYFDFKSGVDLQTRRTPFSGGSGALPDGLISSKQTLVLAIVSLLAAVLIGIYFVMAINTGWQLLPLLFIAIFCIVLYTPLILKTQWPEWAPGVSLGSLPVLGAYFVQTGAYTLPAIIASIPSAILVHNLLLLSEFPDVEADSTANRKTMPIVLGSRKAGVIYSALTLIVYLWTISSVVAGIMPVFSLLALLTIPFAFKAVQGALKSQEMARLVPGLANNVLVVLLTQLLLGIGYILAGIFSNGGITDAG
ncbi:MAG: prenyltransferase [Dehalococcoidales bacterium]